MVQVDPVHRDEKDGLWYYWNETWSDRYGPYSGRTAADAALTRYTQYLNKVNRVAACGDKPIAPLPPGVRCGACCNYDYDCLLEEKQNKLSSKDQMLFAGLVVMTLVVGSVFVYGLIRLLEETGILS